ncbi:MAG TPA: fused MFS/spermidine synthase [Thermomicrobiales bacterium]|jgi:predicted membrane-bound spermidine synthase|nr:fused MFS/spermidine synthase [Thermomicrobiales bacterium]
MAQAANVTIDQAGPSPDVSPLIRRLIMATVFLGGISSIGIEITASRLIAPYFGDSTLIWANIIGVTLAFLSLGYWIGGRVADRHPSATLLFLVTGIAAAFAGLIPAISRPILDVSIRAFEEVAVGAFYGSLIGTLLILGIPTTLLGFVSPFAIRLLVSDVAASGTTAGNLYALSTVGSIGGSFLPVLLLIPTVGTARSFLVLAALLLVPAVIALLMMRQLRGAGVVAIAGVAMVVVALAVEARTIRAAEFGTLVYETESSYNYIQVVERDGTYSLILNEGHAVHSIYDPDQLLTGGPWDYFMVAPLLGETTSQLAIDNALVIGLAGGTVARQLTAAYGPIAIDGVEIDPEIARLGDEYFRMSEEAPGLEVHVADGRYFLRTSAEEYHLVAVDAYHQPYIPFQLTTREFFVDIADHLQPGGVAAINVGRTETDYRLVDAIASTMNAVFPYVYAIDTARYTNTLLIGSMSPAGLAGLASGASTLPDGAPLQVTAQASLETGNPRLIDPGGEIWTDDYAPVEQVIDLIILDEARRREDQ